MHFESNYKARQSLNQEYAKIKGASAINDVAIGFGKGWIVFAILSTLASAFSFYQDFYKSLGVVITVIMVIVLAIALEAFKHLSIKGMFSSMNFISKGIVSAIAIALIAVSFYTHFKSIQTFQKNLVGDDLKKEISYQRDLQNVQNKQINSILASNKELSKALNNGSSSDDSPSVRSVESNNELIKTLQQLAIQNNMTNTNLILEQSRATAHTTSAAILVIFIMVEIMALFSILSKIIIVDNVSGNIKDFVNVMDRLDELEHNTYQSLSSQKVEQTNERIKMVQKHQDVQHKKELNKIAFQKVEAEEEEKQISTVRHTDINEEEMPKKKKKKLKKDKQIEKNTFLDIHQFDQTEQILLKLLWKSGTVQPNEALMPRKKVLEKAGGLKGKSGVLSNLYAKLLDGTYIEFDKRYKAKVSLIK
jgi:biopolymer transport protein ExbB/TolQ